MEESRKELMPNYGHLMTRKEFIESVKKGFLIDYDGSGHYSDGEYIYPDAGNVYPSRVKRNGLKQGYSHIVWYNR